MADKYNGRMDVLEKQFTGNNLPAESVLAKLLKQLPEEDIQNLKLKAIDGKLGIELKRLSMNDRFNASTSEIREFLDYIENLQDSTRSSTTRWEAEHISTGATGKTRITVKKGCFIATAVYGSSEHVNVKRLCYFRDQYLTQFKIGRFFCTAYYKVSPHMVASEFFSRSLYKPFELFINLFIKIIDSFHCIKWPS